VFWDGCPSAGSWITGNPEVGGGIAGWGDDIGDGVEYLSWNLSKSLEDESRSCGFLTHCHVAEGEVSIIFYEEYYDI